MQFKFQSPLSMWGNVIAGFVAVLVIMFVVWWIFIKPGQDRFKIAQGEADASYATGRTTSATEATTAIIANQGEETKYDEATSTGNVGIRATAGPDDPVNRAANCASARAQCMQRSYHGSRTCQSMLESCASIGH